MNHDVFISYSRHDKDIADSICDAFDQSGITYWIDRGEITSGDAFHEKIVEAIKGCKITIFVSSESSNMSIFTIKEIVIAFKYKKHIIPFCADDKPYASKLEFYLCDLDQLQYYLLKEFAIDKLVTDVKKLIKTPTAPIANDTLADEIDKGSRLDAEKIELERKELERLKAELDEQKRIIEERNLIQTQRERCLNEIKTISQQDGPTTKNNKIVINDIELRPFGSSYHRGYGYEDNTGVTVIEEKYSTADVFRGHLAKVSTNGKYGFINKLGDEVIPLVYQNAMSFSEGLAAVKLNNMWGYIDVNNHPAIPFEYDDAYSFNKGVASVRKNGKTFEIDINGRIIREK